MVRGEWPASSCVHWPPAPLRPGTSLLFASAHCSRELREYPWTRLHSTYKFGTPDLERASFILPDTYLFVGYKLRLINLQIAIYRPKVNPVECEIWSIFQFLRVWWKYQIYGNVLWPYYRSHVHKTRMSLHLYFYIIIYLLRFIIRISKT